MSFPRYPAYKDSGVEWLGKVPGHWEAQPFYGSVTERRESNAGMLEDNLLSLSYGRIVQKNIDSNDGLLPESFETYQIVRPGDIVLRLTDLQNDKRSLRSAIVDQLGIITSAYLAVTPKTASPRFIHYLLRSYDLTKVFYSMGGGLRQSMKFADLKRMPVVLPTRDEQFFIAAFLDHETAKIDALIAEQQRLIELLNEKRQAVISDAVTKGLNPQAAMKSSGVKWLGDVPEHWGLSRLSEVCEFQSGKAHEPYIDESGEFICVNSRFVSTEGQSRKLCTKNLAPAKQDDILMVMSDLPGGRALAKAFFVIGDEPYAVNQRVCVIRARKGSSRFLYHLLNRNPYFLSYDDQINQTHLPNSAFTHFKFFAPSSNEQIEIASYLDSVTETIGRLASESLRGIDILRERRSALISAAVTGQIDVRGFTSPVAA